MRPVLYVEDEPDDVFFMQYAWEQAGLPHPLVVVRDGQKAIDYLAAAGFQDKPLPCLVLLDLNLPVRSGLDVLRWLRNDPRLCGLKVVIVSGSELDKDMLCAESLGVIDYVVKPGSVAELAEAVRRRKDFWLG